MALLSRLPKSQADILKKCQLTALRLSERWPNRVLSVDDVRFALPIEFPGYVYEKLGGLQYRYIFPLKDWTVCFRRKSNLRSSKSRLINFYKRKT